MRSSTLLSLVCFAGCAGAVRVGPLSVRPNIDMPVSGASLALDLSAVRDSFLVPEQNGVTEVPVEGWRGTLGSGYRNGPGRFFQQATSPDFTLRFSKADLEYTPVAIYERSGGAAAVRARVTYMAQVIDRNGQIVARIKGEAVSRNPWTTFGGSESTAAEAVAQMYEDIADRDLRVLSPVAAATPAPAAPAAAAVSPGGRAGPESEYAAFPPKVEAQPVAECVPACRDGYLCHQGRCISACNPPCGKGEKCIGKGQCVR